jgi:hypothetical protein
LPAPAHKTSTAAKVQRRRALLAFACAAACVAAAPAAANAQTYVVNTASDSASLTCPTPSGGPDCSLRSAIVVSNAHPGADVIAFSSNFVIPIGTPLPPVTDELTISAFGQNVAVIGSGSYDCSGDNYALDLSSATTADPVIVKGLPINAVCGRAIRSNVPAPVVSVGPRRADNSVSISGSTGDGTSVDLFNAKNVSNDGEADSGGFIGTVSSGGGSFSYKPPVEPNASDVFAATTTAPGGTSAFTARVHTPSDLTSPAINDVVAVSNGRVRIDFNELLNGGGAIPSAFTLGMANFLRPIAGVTWAGNSIFLDTSLPWASGEAGVVGLTGSGHVSDAAGNEVLGTPTAPVFAGPGEIDAPVISAYRLSPNRFCQRKSSKCTRGATSILLTLNKPARVIFKVARGTAHRSELVTFVHKLKAGRNKIKFDSLVSGRTLPATILTLRAIAQDVARTYSAPVDAAFKIVKSKRDL